MNNKIIILLIGMLCCIPISGYIVGAVELGQQFTQQQINSVNPLDIDLECHWTSNWVTMPHRFFFWNPYLLYHGRLFECFDVEKIKPFTLRLVITLFVY